MSEGLKPCPFCGSNEIHIAHDKYRQYQFLCEDCCAKGPKAEYQNQALALWNKEKAEVLTKRIWGE